MDSNDKHQIIDLAIKIHGITNLAMATQARPEVVEELKNLLQETLGLAGMTIETFFSNY